MSSYDDYPPPDGDEDRITYSDEEVPSQTLTEAQQLERARTESLRSLAEEQRRRNGAGPSNDNQFQPLVDLGAGSSSGRPPLIGFNETLEYVMDVDSWVYPEQTQEPPDQDHHMDQEDEGEDQVYTRAGRHGFNFFGVPETRTYPCWISANGSPFVGSLGHQSNWSNHIRVDQGRMATPKFAILVRNNLEFGTDKAIDHGDETSYHEFSIQWQPGVLVADGSYQLHAYEASPYVKPIDTDGMEVDERSDFGAPGPGPEELEQAPSEIKQRLVRLRLATNSGAVQHYNDRWFDSLSTVVEHAEDIVPVPDAELKLISELITPQCLIDLVFFLPDYPDDAQRWCETVDQNIGYAVNHRLPPLWTLYDTEDPHHLRPDLDLNCPDIFHFEEGMMLKYQKADEARLLHAALNQENIVKPEQPTGFREYPKGFGHWTDETEFGLSYQLAVIRNHQWEEGQFFSVVGDWHSGTLVKTARLSTPLERAAKGNAKGKGKEQERDVLGQAAEQHRKHFFLYVSIYRTDDQKAALPKDIPWRVDFFRPDRAGNHQLCSPSQMWFGTPTNVASDKLATTGADICLLVTRPPNGFRQRALNSLDEFDRASSPVQIRLFPIVTSTTMLRQLNALRVFMNTDVNYLDDLRIPLIYGKEKRLVAKVDLRLGPLGNNQEGIQLHTAYVRHLSTIEGEGELNNKMLTALNMIESMHYGLLLIQGPPGTQKTTLLAENALSLSLLGYKQVVCSDANGAVDAAANKIFKAHSRELKGPYAEQFKTKKFLRLLPLHQEMRTLRKMEEAGQIKDTAAAGESWKDDPITLRVLAQIQEIHSTELDQLEWKGRVEEARNKLRNLEEEYNVVEAAGQKRVLECPREMTLWYRMMETINDDIVEFGECSPWGEFQRLLEKRRVQELDEDEARIYEGMLDRLIKKVVQETDILCTTLVNFASDQIQEAPVAWDILHHDEAALSTVPSALIPLTLHEFKAQFCYGDNWQLCPTVASKGRNEKREDLETSWFSALSDANMPCIRLNTQYRMTPAIAQFPGGYVYGNLVNAPCTRVLHETTRLAQQVSQELYDIKGPSGHGSEYMVISADQGVSTREATGGMSLQNHTEAEIATNMIKAFMAKGIKPENIGVASYYNGQLPLMKAKLSVIKGGRTIKIGSVDSFQGSDKEVMIIMIVATGHVGYGEEARKRGVFLSNHVKRLQRVNVSVTRAKYAEVVIGNFESVAKDSSFKDDQNKVSNMLEGLLKNAVDRKLLAHDDTPDCNPDRAGFMANPKNKKWADKMIARRQDRRWVETVRKLDTGRELHQKAEVTAFQYVQQDGTIGRYPLHILDKIRVRSEDPAATDVPGIIRVDDNPASLGSRLTQVGDNPRNTPQQPGRGGGRGGARGRGRGRGAGRGGGRGSGRGGGRASGA